MKFVAPMDTWEMVAGTNTVNQGKEDSHEV